MSTRFGWNHPLRDYYRLLCFGRNSCEDIFRRMQQNAIECLHRLVLFVINCNLFVYEAAGSISIDGEN